MVNAPERPGDNLPNDGVPLFEPDTQRQDSDHYEPTDEDSVKRILDLLGLPASEGVPSRFPFTEEQRRLRELAGSDDTPGESEKEAERLLLESRRQTIREGSDQYHE